jgi:hypothetical protein
VTRRSTPEKENASLRHELGKQRRKNELLQQEIHRVWGLVPTHYINLMGVYPPLRKLLHVLAEAADAQDPTRGAPSEDTMRTEYVPDGETLTPTERGMFAHWQNRTNVRHGRTKLESLITRILAAETSHLAGMVRATEWEYNPPAGHCLECNASIIQPPTGRPRKYCFSCAPMKTVGKR